MLADPSARKPAEAILTAVRSHRLHAEQLVAEAIVRHDDHLTSARRGCWRAGAPAGDAGRSDLAPAAHEVARRLRPALELAAWDRGYCPICGGRPLLGRGMATVGSTRSGVAAAPRPGHGACQCAQTAQVGRLAVIETQDIGAGRAPGRSWAATSAALTSNSQRPLRASSWAVARGRPGDLEPGSGGAADG